MKIKKLYKFNNIKLESDQVDPKTGKVKEYKEVAVIATSIDEAYVIAGLNEEYTLAKCTRLGDDWN